MTPKRSKLGKNTTRSTKNTYLPKETRIDSRKANKTTTQIKPSILIDKELALIPKF